MQIAIYQPGRPNEIHALDRNVVFLGEEGLPAPGNAKVIRLPKGSASGLQFEIRRGGEGYSIQNHGGVFAEFRSERFDTRRGARPVREDDYLVLPAATVMFIPDGATGGGGQQAARAPTGDEWQVLQEAIHARLRDEFELDKGQKLADIAKDRDDITRRLRIVVNEDVAAVKDVAPLNQFVEQAVLRRALRHADDEAARKEAESRSNAEKLSAREEFSPQDRRIEGKLAELVQAALDRLRRTGKLAPQGNQGLPIQDFKDVVKGLLSLLQPLEKQDIARLTLYENIYDLIFELGPISDLLDVEAVSEIMVVRYDQIYFERGGEIAKYPYNFTGERQLVTVIRRMLYTEGRSFNRTSAMVDFRYQGHRVNAIGDPLAIKGAALTIRKFPSKGRPRPGLFELATKRGSMSLSVAAFLRRATLARKNIVISGGTGSGKTTLLNALGRTIPEHERVVTIEDTAEMDFGEGQHVVSLQARPATVESKNEVTIRDLVRNALRMRPDRIVIGECRGAEALDMLQAMNTGHAGSMTTAHANSTHDMMLRLETMVLQAGERLPVSAVRQQIVGAVDLIVQLNRIGNGRYVTDVAEVIGVSPEDGTVIVESIYRLLEDDEGSGTARSFFTGYLPTFVEEVLAIPDDPTHVPPVLFA